MHRCVRQQEDQELSCCRKTVRRYDSVCIARRNTAQFDTAGLPCRPFHHELATLRIENVLMTVGKYGQLDLIELDDLRHKLFM